MTNHYTDVCEETIKSLRQQLAELKNTWLSPETYKTLMEERQETLRELSDHLKREVMLRDGLKRADDLLRTSYDHVSPLIREALATTDDLKDVRLCHAEPVAWIDGGDLRELGNGNDRQYSLWCENQDRMVPLYRAWEPK